MKTNPLIGKTLASIEIAKDRQAIRFILTDGEIIAETDAAVRSGQIVGDEPNKRKLFSEDLW